ncbi:hypothetical protein D3Z39_12435 [Anaerotruncus colihominis]|uniref:Uncharacterized protein n=1 Tax=Anaerotruncus colihominis TaxID=169435 RepID=A0A845RLM0_9FIRM|nr:hypothetical protein [Anaerotruncus colihominis]
MIVFRRIGRLLKIENTVLCVNMYQKESRGCLKNQNLRIFQTSLKSVPVFSVLCSLLFTKTRQLLSTRS